MYVLLDNDYWLQLAQHICVKLNYYIRRHTAVKNYGTSRKLRGEYLPTMSTIFVICVIDIIITTMLSK